MNEAGGRYKSVKPFTNKIERAWPFALAVGRGDVYMIKDESNMIVSNELAAFGSGDGYDDIVDAYSYAYNEVSRPKMASYGG